MAIDKKTVKHVAELARLNLTDEETDKFAPQLSEILEAFSKLDEIDTTKVKPSFHPVPTRNTMREDHPKESITQEQAIRNAHHKEEGYFKGPKAL